MPLNIFSNTIPLQILISLSNHHGDFNIDRGTITHPLFRILVFQILVQKKTHILSKKLTFQWRYTQNRGVLRSWTKSDFNKVEISMLQKRTISYIYWKLRFLLKNQDFSCIIKNSTEQLIKKDPWRLSKGLGAQTKNRTRDTQIFPSKN